MQLIVLMYGCITKRPDLAVTLTRFELPNLLATLEWSRDHSTPERVMQLSHHVEPGQNLGRPQTLAIVTQIREHAAERLREDAPLRFANDEANIYRLLASREWQTSRDAAERLLSRSLAAGDAENPDAAHMIASAQLLLAMTIRKCGNARAALETISEARTRSQSLADAGSADAARLVAVALSETGECLSFWDGWTKAAVFSGKRQPPAQMGDMRSVAVYQRQIGRVNPAGSLP